MKWKAEEDYFRACGMPDFSDKPALIIGSKLYEGSNDRRELYKNAIGLDFQEGDGVDVVHDLEKSLLDNVVLYDHWSTHIDCLSVLEHVKRPWKAAENIEYFMDAGDTLFLSVPFVWREHGYPSDYWRFTIEGVKELFPNILWQKICYMSNGVEVRHQEAKRIDGRAFLGRTEVFGYGIKK